MIICHTESVKSTIIVLRKMLNRLIVFLVRCWINTLNSLWNYFLPNACRYLIVNKYWSILGDGGSKNSNRNMDVVHFLEFEASTNMARKSKTYSQADFFRVLCVQVSKLPAVLLHVPWGGRHPATFQSWFHFYHRGRPFFPLHGFYSNRTFTPYLHKVQNTSRI